VSELATRPAATESRYAIQHDIERPHVRLGVIWFALVLLALLGGALALAVLYGGVAAVGALQTAKAWRRRRQRPSMPVAGVGAMLLPFAAIVSSQLTGATVLCLVIAALVAALLDERRRGVVTDSALTVQSALFIGLAAACVVLVYQYAPGAALALVILVSGYESGDYVVGSGAPNSFEGPLAGFAAVAVLSFSLFVVEPDPFDGAGVLVYGAVIGVLAPLGQLFASALLPEANVLASGLRRLDSLLLAGPAWFVLLGLGVGQ
jgi:CDP-diglyceride synthetase